MDAQQKKIHDFIHGLEIGVISTISETGLPQGAVVQFAETERLEIIFNTFTTYRKYANLKANPALSFTIGWDHDITVQYEGTARELEGEDLIKYKALFNHKLPKSVKWDAYPETRFFIVKPTWIRYNDLNPNHKESFVVKF